MAFFLDFYIIIIHFVGILFNYVISKKRDIPQVNKYVNSPSCNRLCVLVFLNYFFI